VKKEKPDIYGLDWAAVDDPYLRGVLSAKLSIRTCHVSQADRPVFESGIADADLFPLADLSEELRSLGLKALETAFPSLWCGIHAACSAESLVARFRGIVGALDSLRGYIHDAAGDDRRPAESGQVAETDEPGYD
jgi:hypothetical protein